MFGWLFGKKDVESVFDGVLGFFEKVDRLLGIFDSLIHEGRELIQKIEGEIREHEEQIRELERSKEEVARKVEQIEKILGR